MSYGGQTHNTQYLPSIYFLFDRSDTHGYITRQSFLHFCINHPQNYRVDRGREVSDNKCMLITSKSENLCKMHRLSGTLRLLHKQRLKRRQSTMIGQKHEEMAIRILRREAVTEKNTTKPKWRSSQGKRDARRMLMDNKESSVHKISW